MQAKLVSDAGERVEVDIPETGHVEVYRVPDRRSEVVADVVETSSEPIGLDIYDPSVSRRGTDDDPKYVKLFLDDGQVFVIDLGMSHGVKLTDGFETVSLTPGERYAIHQDETLHLGHNTTLGVRVSGDRGDVPMIWRINQCRKWLRKGKNRDALREAQGLLDQLRTTAGDHQIPADLRSEFENVVTKLQNQIEIGDDRSDERVPESIRDEGLRVLDRLEHRFGR